MSVDWSVSSSRWFYLSHWLDCHAQCLNVQWWIVSRNKVTLSFDFKKYLFKNPCFAHHLFGLLAHRNMRIGYEISQTKLELLFYLKRIRVNTTDKSFSFQNSIHKSAIQWAFQEKYTKNIDDQNQWMLRIKISLKKAIQLNSKKYFVLLVSFYICDIFHRST